MPLSPMITTRDLPPSLLSSARLVGFTPTLLSTHDPRVSYSLYIPDRHYDPDPRDPPIRPISAPRHSPSPPHAPLTHDSPVTPPSTLLPVLVLLHGTTRQTTPLLAAFKELADSHGCALLAPLFPAGLEGPNDWDGFWRGDVEKWAEGAVESEAVVHVRNPAGDGVSDHSSTRDNPIAPAQAPAARPRARAPVGPALTLKHILEHELHERWPGLRCGASRRCSYLLAGFSAGAALAQKLALGSWGRGVFEAVSLAAPGELLVLEQGLEGVDKVLGENGQEGRERKEVKRQIAWQLLVGAEDTALQGSLEGLARVSRGWSEMGPDVDWMARARREMGAGGENGTRRAALERFAEELRGRKRAMVRCKCEGGCEAGNADRDCACEVRVELVQGAGHVLAELAPSMVSFFEGILGGMHN